MTNLAASAKNPSNNKKNLKYSKKRFKSEEKVKKPKTPEIKLVISDVDGVIRLQDYKTIHETYLKALKAAGFKNKELKRFNQETTHALRKLTPFINEREKFFKLLFHLTKANENEFKSVTESAKKGKEDEVLKFLEEREKLKSDRISNSILQKMNEAYKFRYDEEKLKEIKPYKGAFEGLKLLEKLGIRVVFVSSAPRESIKQWFEIHYGKNSSKKFSFLGKEDVKMQKPSSEGIFKALELSGIDRKNALYVGDHVNDIISGNEAGVYTVGVLSDLSSVKEFLEHDPHYIFNSFKELAEWLEGKKVDFEKRHSKKKVVKVSCEALKQEKKIRMMFSAG